MYNYIFLCVATFQFCKSRNKQIVYRRILELDSIEYADYQLSICGDELLREVLFPGKHGRVFILSNDKRFVFKTLRKSEMKVINESLVTFYSLMDERLLSIIFMDTNVLFVQMNLVRCEIISATLFLKGFSSPYFFFLLPFFLVVSLNATCAHTLSNIFVF